ncbi:hypothetical protein [Pedobacter arcticus]|uniref:hypothetical protein n=1 Tax=Pedobacter arcticus TaxID=752140 RepID=UPI0012B52518|nr:hypothetical protein [Pedobacter arcticus]
MINSPKLAELKKELNHLQAAELKELCLRLAKHKTENKELLNFLLFYPDKKEAYMEEVKTLIINEFNNLHPSIYLATKQIRKLLRLTNKHIKFIATKHLEAELALAFCKEFITHPIITINQKATIAILISQLKRLNRVIPKLEDDFQFDYQKEFDGLIELLKQKRKDFSERDLQ